ncbi:Mitochondrial distribution and morphology protein 10 [Rhizophlyctis rosea]|nr:Mitochondrial distribution and morphology protein 10 [Rhizophlyctis rosea]
MLDYMEYCLLRLLDFRIPQGFYLSLGKSISPELKGCYTLGLPNVRSVGFLFSSVPFHLPKQRLTDEADLLGDRRWGEPEDERSIHGDKLEEKVLTVADGVTGSETDIISQTPDVAFTASAPPDRDYLIYGRLFEDLRLEALYTRTLTPNTILVGSGVSFWKGDASTGRVSKVTAQLLHSAPQWCGEVSYTSEDHVVGVSGLYRFGKSNWAAGSEIYYTGRERSGGLSIGARYKKYLTPNVKSTFTLLASPVMGHVAAAYTTTVSPGLNVSTRYKLNVYSYETDVGVGFEYAPAIGESKVMGTTVREQCVKAKISLIEGLAVKLEGRYKEALVGIGFMTQFGRGAWQSLGVELQMS